MPSDLAASYYTQSFGSERHRRGQMVNARVNRRAVARLVDLRKTTTMLDVGTGYGFLLAALRGRYGLKVHGVEPSSQEAAYAREKLCLPVHSGTLADADFEPGSFDLVTCFEVIEHMTQPVELVRDLVRFVRPGGHLLVMTDNFGARVVRRMGPQWPKWIPHSHVSHFTPSTLEACLGQVGELTIMRRISYTPWENLVVAWAQRGRSKSAGEAFALREVLESEMGGRYRAFRLRMILNAAWFRMTARPDLSGALMFVLARRDGSD